MKTEGVYYLAREGKTFGPFTDSDIERLRRNGTFTDYHWMWADASGKWEAVVKMPVGPPAKQGTAVGGAFSATRALVLFGKRGEAGMHEGTILTKGALGCEIEVGHLKHPLPIRSRSVSVQLVDSKGAFRTEVARITEVRGSRVVLEWVSGPAASSKIA